MWIFVIFNKVYKCKLTKSKNLKDPKIQQAITLKKSWIPHIQNSKKLGKPTLAGPSHISKICILEFLDFLDLGISGILHLWILFFGDFCFFHLFLTIFWRFWKLLEFFWGLLRFMELLSSSWKFFESFFWIVGGFDFLDFFGSS